MTGFAIRHLELSMFSPVDLHPGLLAQYSKLRTMGYALTGFILLAACDLFYTIFSKNEAIVQWRAAVEPALIMVLVIAPAALYMLVWQRMRTLIHASQVVQKSTSRAMILKTWQREHEPGRNLFFFELVPEEQFGCVSSSYLLVSPDDSKRSLPLYCDQSWTARTETTGVVKAFVDDYTGLPVALQTTDALLWISIDVYLVNPDDREMILKKAEDKRSLPD